MVSVVDKLEAMQVLGRKLPRRIHALFLTKDGEKYYAELITQVREHEQQFMDLLQGDAAAIISDVLDRFAAVKFS